MVLVFLFLLGASLASFVSLAFYRSRSGLKTKDILFGRSACERCGENIPYPYLAPVVGYVLSRGKCRRCGGEIDPFHPASEIAAGVYASSLYLSGIEPSKWIFAFAGFLLFLVAAREDLESQTVPDVPILTAFLLSVSGSPRVLDALEGGASLAGTLLVVRVASSIYYTAKEKREAKRAVERSPWTSVYFPKEYTVEAFGEGDVVAGLFVGASLGFADGAEAYTVAFLLLGLHSVLSRNNEEALPLFPYLLLSVPAISVLRSFGIDIIP